MHAPIAMTPESPQTQNDPGSEQTLQAMASLATRVAGATISPEVLRQVRGELGGLRAVLRIAPDELGARFGLSRRAVLRLQDALCLSIYAAEENDGRLSVTSAADIYERFSFLSLETNEAFWLASLDAANRLTGLIPIARGDDRAIRLDPADVLGACVSHGARRVVAVHNHPGGSADPSQQDLAFTRKLIRAARLLGIHLLDHVVIGHGAWSSMRDRALLPFDN
jgi:DNA repair protein RadC